MLIVLIYCAAEERITVSREQLTKIQEICDHAGIGDSTVSNHESGLPEIEINVDDDSSYCNDEDRDLFPEGIPPSYNHSGINYDKGMLLVGHF